MYRSIWERGRSEKPTAVKAPPPPKRLVHIVQDTEIWLVSCTLRVIVSLPSPTPLVCDQVAQWSDQAPLLR